jgi:hypothetical protein
MASQYLDPNLTIIIQILIAVVTVLGSFLGSSARASRRGLSIGQRWAL